MKSYLVVGVLAVTLSAGAAASSARSDSLLGAAEAIKRLSPSAAVASAEGDEIGQLLRDLERYDADGLAPEAAVAQWVALYGRWSSLTAKVDPNNPGHFDVAAQGPLSGRSLLIRLPAPEAWPKLEQGLRKARIEGSAGAGLEVLSALLNGGSMAKAMERARAKIAQLPKDERLTSERKLKAIEAMVAAGSDASLVQRFERDLEERAGSATSSRLDVPDLVTLVGRPRAGALLARALMLPATSISVPVGEDTRVLAQEILLEKVAQLRVPHWGLVRLPKAKAVYEALTTQFPEASKNTLSPEEALARMRDDATFSMDYGSLYQGAEERTQAQLHYLVALIVANEAARAEPLAMRLAEGDGFARTGSALLELRRAGYSAELYGFFKTLLERNPTVGAWTTFFELAAENGKNEEALAVVEKALRTPTLGSGARRDLESQRVKAFLSADQVEPAITEIDRLIKATSKDDGLSGFRAELALTLLEVSRLLERPKDFERALGYLQAELARPSPKQQRADQDTLRMKVVTVLRRAGRLAEAERLLLASLSEWQQGSEAQMMSAFAMAPPGLQAQLVELVGVYQQAERWQDVVRLTEGVSLWGVSDLAPIADTADSRKVPFAYMVARALIAQGDGARAKPILEAVIASHGGFDPAYEAYVDSLGEGAIAFLDQVYRRDRFEERPVIWKAVALVRARKAAEAEAVARQAISVDPSDGEQGAGHRMRAYAILADALEQRGQLEAAQSYRGAIQAIRVSERADELRLGGLHRRAIVLYQDALTKFSDAYCIQSRLAVELAHAGRAAEAEQHYRRAYELMPDSFGRVESHCFGCEKVFETKTAQGVAENVFQGLLKKAPEKAQVHYLMGYLRYEQGRYADAVQFFRTAVAIDPEYLNAWKKLADSGSRVHLGRAERDLITLKILSLDPQQRHSSPDLSRVADLRALWFGVRAARAAAVGKPTNLYPLPASAARRAEVLAKLPEPMRRSAEIYDRYAVAGDRDRKDATPGEVVGNTTFIREVVRLIDRREYY